MREGVKRYMGRGVLAAQKVKRRVHSSWQKTEQGKGTDILAIRREGCGGKERKGKEMCRKYSFAFSEKDLYLLLFIKKMQL